jgi:RNA polymerase II C-terminal domain phosphatase-like 1/2
LAYSCNLYLKCYASREFDENLLRRISEVYYEDEVVNLPPAPDVSNYMMSEDAGFVPNGNGNAPISEGMNGVEVERRLNTLDEKYVNDSATHSLTNSPDLRYETSQPSVAIIPNVIGHAPSRTLMPSQKPGLLGAPVNRDSDMKRGLLTMKHGLDLRNQSSGEPPLLSRLPTQASSLMQPQGGWLVEDDISGGNLNNRPLGSVQDADSFKPDKQRGHFSPFSPITPGSTPTGLLSQTSQMKVEEACAGYDLQKQNLPPASQLLGMGT